MLALQYGIMAVSGGVQAKVALALCKDLIQEALEQAVKSASASQNVLRSLDIIGDIVTIGGLSIASVGASGICGVVSFVSLIVACCMSGKKQSGYQDGRATGGAAKPLWTGYVDKTPNAYIADVNSPWQSPTTPATPATPYQYSDHRISGRQMV